MQEKVANGGLISTPKHEGRTQSRKNIKVSWKDARDVTAEVNPNKQTRDPLARARRKFKKAGALQLQKWGRRLIKALKVHEAAATWWKEGLDPESPLTLRDYPFFAQMLSIRATLQAAGEELARRSNDEQASRVMEVAANNEKTLDDSCTTPPTSNPA